MVNAVHAPGLPNLAIDPGQLSFTPRYFFSLWAQSTAWPATLLVLVERFCTAFINFNDRGAQ